MTIIEVKSLPLRHAVADESIPPIGLIGAFVVGGLFGGLLIYAIVAHGPTGLACFTDGWNALSLVVGLAGGFIVALYFEYRGVQRERRQGRVAPALRDYYAHFADQDLRGLIDRPSAQYRMDGDGRPRFGFLDFLREYFRPRRKLDLPDWPPP